MGDWAHWTGTATRQENEDASVGTAASKTWDQRFESGSLQR
jgi:hypothetical protein